MAIALDNFVDLNTVETTTVVKLGAAIGVISIVANNDAFIEGQNSNSLTMGKATFPAKVGAGFTVQGAAVQTITTGERHVFWWLNDFVWNKGTKAAQIFGSAARAENTTQTGGNQIHINDALNAALTTGNYREYHVSGSDREVYGGWRIYAVDPVAIPNLSTSSGSATIALFNGMWPPGTALGTGLTSQASVGSIKTFVRMLQTVVGVYGNCDAAKIVSGYRITTGIENLNSLFDQDSVNNGASATLAGDGYPVGVLTRISGIYYQNGKITVGSNTTVQYTELSEEGQTIVFPEQLVRNTFNRLDVAGGGVTASGSATPLGTTTIAKLQFGLWDGSSASAGCILRGGGYFFRPFTATTGTTTITVTFATTGIASQLRVGMRVFGPHMVPNNYIIAIPGTQSIQMSARVENAITSLFYFYSPLWGMWSSFVNNNSSSQFRMYASSASEVHRLYLSSASEIRETTFTNFGGIDANGALIDNCSFSDVQSKPPVFGKWAIETTTAGIAAITNCNFDNAIVALRVEGSAGASVTKDMSGFSFGGNVKYVSGTFSTTANLAFQITGVSSTAGILVGEAIHHDAAYTNISYASVTLTANATTDTLGQYADASAVQFNIGSNPIMAGMEVVAGTYGTAVVPPNTFVKRVISNNQLEFTNRVTGTTATGQTVLFRLGPPFVTGISGTTIFMSQAANRAGNFRIPIGNFVLENAIAANAVSGGSNTTFNSNVQLFSGGNVSVAQSFPGNNQKLSSVTYRINRFGNPTGLLRANLYAHSGTFGTSSVPTGAALASSYTANVATLGTTQEEINFMFNYTTGTDFTISSGTNYVVSLEFISTSSSSTNSVNVAVNTSNVAVGNFSGNTGTAWTAFSAIDMFYRVFSDGNMLLTNSDTAWPVYASRGGGISLVTTSYTLTITGIEANSEVRIFDNATLEEITGIETVSITDGITYTDGVTRYKFDYTYVYSVSLTVDIVVFNVNFQYFRLTGYKPAASNSSLPITQITDRQYI